MSIARSSPRRQGSFVALARGWKRNRRRGVALGLGALLALGFVWAPQASFAADPTAVLGIEKKASAAEVKPGETLTYTVEVSCSTISDVGCVGASFTDAVPPEFIIESVNVTNAPHLDPQVNGQNVTVIFNEELDEERIGLVANAIGTVTITVRLRDDVAYEKNGVKLPNTAKVTADNAEPKSSTASVTPIVEKKLSTEATKSFSPKIGQAKPGAPTQLTIGGANKSNGGVDSIQLTDPTDPNAPGNPFEHLAITGVSSVNWPEGANTVLVEYWNGSAWVSTGSAATKPGAPNAPPESATGIRVTFTDSAGKPLPAGATGGLVLDLEQRDSVADLEESLVVRNTVESVVTSGTESSKPSTATDDYKIVTEPITVKASKSFSPDVVLPGGASTVKLGASNAGETPLGTLVIREPAEGPFDSNLTFTGFTGDVEFPQGADKGAIVIEYIDTNGDPQSFSADLTPGGGYPPLPADFGSLISFEITYTNTDSSPIIAGAETSIEFGVTAAEGLAKDTKIDNVVGVTGTSVDGTDEANDKAKDTLTIDERRVELNTEKTISPGKIWGYKGEVATVKLPTTVGLNSTTNAQQIVVNEPELGANGNPAASDWWDHFTPTAITKTDVPEDTTLVVRYFDKVSGTWQTLRGGTLEGADSLTVIIPENLRDIIGGLQFEFTNTADGFAPETKVQPNITTELKESLPGTDQGGKDIRVENCSSASATGGPGVTPAEATVGNPCPAIDILAPTPGEHDLLDKHWTSPADGLVVARSGDHAISRLNWSTDGRSGFDRVVIADTRVSQDLSAGPIDPVEKTTYQAFNLVKIRAITAEMDPHLRFDRIAAVQLWNGSSWANVKSSAVDGYDQGFLPELALDAQEQATTLAVRLIVEENAAAREASNEPDAPPVGSGVARSNGNDRALDLEWEVRDTKRVPADGSQPVLGSELYNTDTKGDVNNIAGATAYVDGAPVAHDQDSDIISILDRPLNVSITKGWSGGPLGIPPTGTATELYPSGRVTITATNATVAKVDTLSIVDPSPGALTSSPFDTFDLAKIVNITVPSGTTSTAVRFIRVGGADLRQYTVAEAKALTAAELADVVGIQVAHDGRIVSAGKSTLTMDLRLRATHRSDNTPVTVVNSPVANEASARVTDPGGVGGVHEVTAKGSAQIALAELRIGVLTTKSFDPAVQYAELLPSEPGYDEAPWDAITMTLSARPSGSARPAQMVVTDDTPTFWNAYRFEGFKTDFTPAKPIDRVKVDALVGGTFVEGPGNTLTLSGGQWIEGEAGTSFTLPDSVNNADVQGLRFTFDRQDGQQWENPSNPKQEIQLSVKRRPYLASSTTEPRIPVPSDAQPAAPGEGLRENGGHFTNTVNSVVTGAAVSEGQPALTAEHSTTAQAFYEAGGTEVSVKKTPIGAQIPGQTIPFVLTVSNPAPESAGIAKAILNPVITDVLPLDDAPVEADRKPWLVFDPESTDPRYAYAYQSGATPGAPNLPMPTDPAQITVTESRNSQGEPTVLAFTFPEGTVLMPGESYSITINMMFRPGIRAEQHVTNTFEVMADEPFKFCNGREDVVFGCAADTEVYPSAIGALRGQKFVKADDTELGVTNVTNPAATCAPTLGDFYSGDCVPITKPLGTETWRERVQNTGTLEMDRVVTIDRLPTPGDQGALVLLPRGSQWQPLWTGPVTPVTEAGYRVPDGVEYYYSTADNPCVADLSPAHPACPPGAWMPLAEGVDATTVKHIKTVFRFDENHFLPGDQLGYTFQTRTPAVSPVATADTVAWNSIAIGAGTVQTDGAPIGDVLPTEGRRVGVALATGPLAVEKTVTGVGAALAPAEFQLTVLCTVGKGTAFETELDPRTITVKAGERYLLPEQLPWGAECEVQDVPGANGESGSWSPSGPVTIARSTEAVQVATLANRYDHTALVVDKKVTGALHENGEPVDYGSFEFSVACTFLGNPVLAAGYESSPMVFTLEAGDKHRLDGFPVGAGCAVTEETPSGAAVSIEVAPEGAAESVEGGTANVILAHESEFTPAVQVSVTNSFPLGGIDLLKNVVGDGVAAISDDTTFEFDLTCRTEQEEVYHGLLTMTKAEAVAQKRVHVGDLPLGALCSLEETDSGGATESVVNVERGVRVTLPDNDRVWYVVGDSRAPLVFHAVNRFAAGELSVTKEIVGAGAERWGTGPFEVSLACTLEGAAVSVPDGATRELTAANGFAAGYSGLPAGAACVLSETRTGGATSSAIVTAGGEPVSGPITIESGAEVALRVINTFDTGDLAVIKKIEGDDAERAQDAQFEVALACTVDRDGTITPIEIPNGATRTLSITDGLRATYTELPVGAACELRETETGDATSTEITPNAGDSAVGVATVAAGSTIELSVVNTFSKTPPTITPTPSPTPSVPGGTGTPSVPPTVPPTDGPGGTPSVSPTTPGGELGNTGAQLPWLWLIGALGLLIGGAALRIRTTKRPGTSA